MIVQSILRSSGSSRLESRTASIIRVLPAMTGATYYQTCHPYKTGPACTCGGIGGTKKHTIKYKPYVRKHFRDHDYKNMGMNRPMSPHLDVFGPTLVAMTSVAQRGTGIALSFLSVVLAGASLLYPGGVTGFVYWIQSYNLPEFLVIGTKCVISLCFWFHYFIGVRFCLFNLGRLLLKKEAYSSAYLAMAASAVCGVAGGLIGHAFSWQ